MDTKKYRKISFEEIAKHAAPYAIRNFVLSDNMDLTPFSMKEPFIVDGIIFGLCTKGKGRLKINFKEYDLLPNTVMVLFPSETVKIIERSDDLLIESLFVAMDFIAEFPLPKVFNVFANAGEWPCMRLSPDAMQDLIEYHAMIVKQYNQVEQPYRIEIVKGLLYTMLMELIGIYMMKNDNENKISSRKEELVNGFFKLLMLHYKKERSVAFYADKLCLTSKYLSTLIKEITGETILSWIHEAVIIESKVLLKSTSKTVLQISEELNFPNPSSFGKFFKQHTGMTPLDFRETA